MISYETAKPLRQTIADEIATLEECLRDIPEAMGTYSLEDLERAVNSDRNRHARELLRQWTEDGDEEEQRETLAYLRKALNENRTSYRRVFK